MSVRVFAKPSDQFQYLTKPGYGVKSEERYFPLVDEPSPFGFMVAPNVHPWVQWALKQGEDPGTVEVLREMVKQRLVNEGPWNQADLKDIFLKLMTDTNELSLSWMICVLSSVGADPSNFGGNWNKVHGKGMDQIHKILLERQNTLSSVPILDPSEEEEFNDQGLFSRLLEFDVFGGKDIELHVGGVRIYVSTRERAIYLCNEKNFTPNFKEGEILSWYKGFPFLMSFREEGDYRFSNQGHGVDKSHYTKALLKVLEILVIKWSTDRLTKAFENKEELIPKIDEFDCLRFVNNLLFLGDVESE